MKFKLVESINLEKDILNEEKFYKIRSKDNTDINTGKEKISNKDMPFFFIGTNDVGKMTSFNKNQLIDYLSKQKSNSHEKINIDLLNELSSYTNNIEIIDVTSKYPTLIKKHPIYKSRLLNSTFSTSRSKAHRRLEQIANDNHMNNLIVHHIDEVEFNNDDDNLFGIDDDNLHQILHKCKFNLKDGKHQWTGHFPMLYYDGAGNYKYTIGNVVITT